jgi:hypothetical protein
MQIAYVPCIIYVLSGQDIYIAVFGHIYTTAARAYIYCLCSRMKMAAADSDTVCSPAPLKMNYIVTNHIKLPSDAGCNTVVY